MTGRGNYNENQLEKLKQFLLANPKGVTGIQLADYIGVSHARAMRLLDVADQNGFLTCIDGNSRNMLIYAYENES
jgi:hypothetical protein